MGGKTKKSIKKDIARAVESMPGMIIEEMGLPSKNPSPTPTKHAHFWLWTGVIIFSLTIFGIWILNARALFFQTIKTPSEEKKILQEANSDLTAIMNGLLKQEEVESNTETTTSTTDDLKNVLSNILNSTVTSSINSSVTTTVNTTTDANN